MCYIKAQDTSILREAFLWGTALIWSPKYRNVLRHIKGTWAKPDCTYWMCSLLRGKNEAMLFLRSKWVEKWGLLIIVFSFLFLFLTYVASWKSQKKRAVIMSGWMETISAINWSPFRWKWGVSIPRGHNMDMMLSFSFIDSNQRRTVDM